MDRSLKFGLKQVDLLPRSKEKVNPPEGVPRLFDLVEVEDERMKLAFFSALGNTVVAEDTDQAQVLEKSSTPDEQL